METKEQTHTWLYIITFISLCLSFVCFMKLQDLEKNQYSYTMEADGTMWKINNRSGRGCVVDKQTIETPTIIGFWEDFSECLSSN